MGYIGAADLRAAGARDGVELVPAECLLRLLEDE